MLECLTTKLPSCEHGFSFHLDLLFVPMMFYSFQYINPNAFVKLIPSFDAIYKIELFYFGVVHQYYRNRTDF